MPSSIAVEGRPALGNSRGTACKELRPRCLGEWPAEECKRHEEAEESSGEPREEPEPRPEKVRTALGQAGTKTKKNTTATTIAAPANIGTAAKTTVSWQLNKLEL
eukprot:GHVT01016901.1.p2 GENE.GHVT01016901.1~~GHVT01016901.1.p2  ORF type:complete len:105 (-),score=21.90 GHVT01016901.1:393-707(-)